jgi:hypothetical protein
MYLGGLTISVRECGKGEQSLVNGVNLMGCQKSDHLIVVKKRMKVRGAKGMTNQRFLEEKHV